MLLTRIVVIFSAVAAVCMLLLVWGCVRGVRADGKGGLFKLHLKTVELAELSFLAATPFVGTLFTLDEQSRLMLSILLYVFDAVGVSTRGSRLESTG